MSANLMKELSKISSVPLNSGKANAATLTVAYEEILSSLSLSFKRESEGSPATFSEFPSDFPGDLKNALGVPKLYSHQRESIDAIRAGKDVILKLSTAAGKTVAFNAPVIEDIRQSGKTALYVYPLRALADDQLDKLQELNRGLEIPLKIAILTGDVPQQARLKMLEDADIVLVSPDLLHHQIYKQRKTGWGDWNLFVKRLGYVVVDEAHTYTGAFGANVSLMLRRLLMSVLRCGGNPDQVRFLMATATIGNPVEFCERLTGRTGTFQLIDKNGATASAQYFGVLKASDNSLSDLEHAIAKVVDSFAKLSGIIFCNSRGEVKVIQRMICRRHGNISAAYYGGLNRDTRHGIIDRLKRGELRVIVSTSALEAGIDLPALDFCVLYGFPGSLMSHGQRIGRAGRSGPRLVLYVPKDSSLDMFYSHNPELFYGSAEHGRFNPDYPLFLEQHTQCAVVESEPIAGELIRFLGSGCVDIVNRLAKSRVIQKLGSGEKASFYGAGYPHMKVNMRGSSAATYGLLLNGEELEEMGEAIAYRETYPGAVYVAHGLAGPERLRIQSIDQSQHVVYAKKETDAYETTGTTAISISPLSKLKDSLVVECGEDARIRVTLSWCRIASVTSGYTEYLVSDIKVCPNHRCRQFGVNLGDAKKCGKCNHATETRSIKERTGEYELDKPLVSYFHAPALRIEVNPKMEQVIESNAVRYGHRAGELSDQAIKAIESPLATSLHSLGHILAKAAPIKMLCAPQDVNCLVLKDKTADVDPGLVGQSLYLYDTVDGGNGCVEGVYDTLGEVTAIALQIVASCTCDEGCPKCLNEYRCPQGNRNLLKNFGEFTAAILSDGLRS